MHIAFNDHKGNHLFSISNAEHPVAVGHFVHFSFEPYDRAQLNENALKHKDALSGTEWRVTRIFHSVRYFDWNRQPHGCWASVVPANDKAREYAKQRAEK